MYVMIYLFSPNLIPSFLAMIQRDGHQKKTVYVLPIFEIKANMELPKNKDELVELTKNSSVIVFHKNFCAACHTVPNFKQWLTTSHSGLELYMER